MSVSDPKTDSKVVQNLAKARSYLDRGFTNEAIAFAIIALVSTTLSDEELDAVTELCAEDTGRRIL